MSRKIQFRGKSTSNKKWVYGDLHLRCLKPHIHTEPVVGSMLSLKFDIDEETIGQFTGLKDKNGNEVYEGDIVHSIEFNDIKHIVLYDEEYAAFMAVLINKQMGTEIETRCHITQEWIDNYPKEVIGNIFDNPELLK